MERLNFDKIPERFLPAITELPEDLAVMATTIRKRLNSDADAVRVVFELSEEFRSSTIYFAGLDNYRRRWRNWLVRRDYDSMTKAGDSNVTALLGRRYGISVRWVWEIIGQPEEDN